MRDDPKCFEIDKPAGVRRGAAPQRNPACSMDQDFRGRLYGSERGPVIPSGGLGLIVILALAQNPLCFALA